MRTYSLHAHAACLHCMMLPVYLAYVCVLLHYFVCCECACVCVYQVGVLYVYMCMWL